MTVPPLLMAAALALAMPVAIVQNRGLVPLAALMALGSLAMLRRSGAWRGVLAPGAVLAALALGAWATLSSAWALERGDALLGGVRLLALTAALALVLAAARAMEEREAKAVLASLVAGAVLGALLLLVELRFGAPLNNALRGFPEPPRSAEGTKPAATLLALLSGPAVFAAFRLAGARLAVPVGLAAALAVFASTSEAARLGLLAAIATGGIALAFPALARRALPALLAIAVLAGPPLLDQVAKGATRAGLLPLSAVHRTLIWDYAAERAAERPLVGFGMDAARSLPGGRDNPDAARLDRLGITGAIRGFFDTAPRGMAELIPLHTHSMPLQIRLELGFIGLALFAAFAFFSGRAAASLAGRGAFAAGAAAAGAAVVVSLLSYGAWQHWWWVSVALATLPLAVLSVKDGR
ncbi:MAG: O-antigen ligase family protein [Acetobacteraceae bacterium]|nr:O-antigen ligase family protein [Acetobacteraceae bacterium]